MGLAAVSVYRGGLRVIRKTSKKRSSSQKKFVREREST